MLFIKSSLKFDNSFLLLLPTILITCPVLGFCLYLQNKFLLILLLREILTAWCFEVWPFLYNSNFSDLKLGPSNQWEQGYFQKGQLAIILIIYKYNICCYIKSMCHYLVGCNNICYDD